MDKKFEISKNVINKIRSFVLDKIVYEAVIEFIKAQKNQVKEDMMNMLLADSNLSNMNILKGKIQMLNIFENYLVLWHNGAKQDNKKEEDKK